MSGCRVELCTGGLDDDPDSYDPPPSTPFLPSPRSLTCSRRDMCRSVDAREALRLGLVNFVLPKAELDAHVLGAPRRVCVCACRDKCAPRCVRVPV